MEKSDYIVQSHLTNNGGYDVQVEIKSDAKEELDIVLSGIKTLIGIIESTVDGDSEKFTDAMREILGYVADNVGFTTGYYAEELNAEISLDELSEPRVDASVQLQLIKDFFKD